MQAAAQATFITAALILSFQPGYERQISFNILKGYVIIKLPTTFASGVTCLCSLALTIYTPTSAQLLLLTAAPCHAVTSSQWFTTLWTPASPSHASGILACLADSCTSSMWQVGHNQAEPQARTKADTRQASRLYGCW